MPDIDNGPPTVLDALREIAQLASSIRRRARDPRVALAYAQAELLLAGLVEQQASQPPASNGPPE
jgi:hypothetical protein